MEVQRSTGRSVDWQVFPPQINPPKYPPQAYVFELLPADQSVSPEDDAESVEYGTITLVDLDSGQGDAVDERLTLVS